MTTLGQISFERRNRRNPEAPSWDLLTQCEKHKEEVAACAVAEAVEPTMELLRAEVTVTREACKVLGELLAMLPDEYQCHYTCDEAEAAAELYRTLGDEGTAQAILKAHACYDEEGDAHWRAGTAVAS